jgi:hypothetical protein
MMSNPQTFTDSDGNVHTVTHSTAVDPDTGDTTVTDSEQIQFLHPTPDGVHPVGSSETIVHEVVTDVHGHSTTSDGVTSIQGSAEHPDAVSETTSSTDSTTGLTTVVTTTADSTGAGTTHTTMVDASGNTVPGPDGTPLDDVEDVDEESGDGDEEPDLAPTGSGSASGLPGPSQPVHAGTHGGGGEEVELEEEDDPFFGLEVVEAEEDGDDG